MQRCLSPLQTETEIRVSQALSSLILAPPAADANAPSIVHSHYVAQVACAEFSIHTLLVPQIRRILQTLLVQGVWVIQRHGTPDHVMVTTKIMHRFVLAWEFMEQGRLVQRSEFAFSVYLCVRLVGKRHL